MNLGINLLLTLTCVFLLVQESVAPPPRRTEPEDHVKEKEKVEDSGLEELGIEYERYLKEVIDVLESDPEFKRKLEAAEETDIRTGKIAHELEYVDHNVRSKLDEVKREELERLRHLAQKEYELTNGIDSEHMKIIPPEHLDHENPHTFEIDDLKKLISKVTSDLNEADKKRRQEFKEYEMQKEFEKQEKLKHLDGTDKEAFEKELKDNETKHKQHDPLHHPGSKQQLEEVWEKQDHMGNQEFNPRVFFQLHDLDGNGYWDQNEVKTLFLKELDKMYQMGAPEDDMRERAEELERMREHVFNEADKNKDQLISYQEFLDQTKKPDFDNDPGWETVDQKPAFSNDEYLEFERRQQQEVQRMIQQGLIPPQPVYQMPPGYHHPQMQQFPQGHHPQQFAQHPGQGYGAHPNAHGQQPQFQQGYHPQAQQVDPKQFQKHSNQYQGHPDALPHPNQFQGAPNHPNQFQGYQGHPDAQAQPHQYQGTPGHHAPQGHHNQVQGHPIPQSHPNQFQTVQGHPDAQGNQFQGLPQGQANSAKHTPPPPLTNELHRGEGRQEHPAPPVIMANSQPLVHDPNSIQPDQKVNPNVHQNIHPNGLTAGSAEKSDKGH